MKIRAPILAAVALLVLGMAQAVSAEKTPRSSHRNLHNSSRPTCAVANASSRRIAQKIKAFKRGDRQSEARRFSFENYSFKTLDDAAQRLFPAGTKMSYVDTMLRERGGAVKSKLRNKSVHYDYHFSADRFACTRTVSIKIDSKTKRVLSARGDGQCH